MGDALIVRNRFKKGIFLFFYEAALTVRLSQSGPAFSASVSVDVCAQIFFARWASPVGVAESDERCNDYELRRQDGVLRQLSEEVGPIVQQGKKNNEQHRCRYSDELTALA